MGGLRGSREMAYNLKVFIRIPRRWQANIDRSLQNGKYLDNGKNKNIDENLDAELNLTMPRKKAYCRIWRHMVIVAERVISRLHTSSSTS
jgi:hypothetical protein